MSAHGGQGRHATATGEASASRFAIEGAFLPGRVE
jgi:hypothetical protein